MAAPALGVPALPVVLDDAPGDLGVRPAGDSLLGRELKGFDPFVVRVDRRRCRQCHVHVHVHAPCSVLSRVLLRSPVTRASAAPLRSMFPGYSLSLVGALLRRGASCRRAEPSLLRVACVRRTPTRRDETARVIAAAVATPRRRAGPRGRARTVTLRTLTPAPRSRCQRRSAPTSRSARRWCCVWLLPFGTVARQHSTCARSVHAVSLCALGPPPRASPGGAFGPGERARHALRNDPD